MDRLGSRALRVVSDGTPDGVAGARPAGIQSVEVAGAILAALMRMPGPCRLADLARASGMPSAKLHRYLVSLVRTGLATQDAASGRYDLGPMALQMGLLGFSRFDLLRYAERSLTALMQATGETAMLGTWSPRGPSIIRLAEARHEFAGSVAHGHACPLTHSATGLVFASFGDHEGIEALLQVELRQNRAAARPGAPRTAEAFAALVAQTRADGVGVVAHGGLHRTSAVSAPVFDADGRLLLSLTVFGQEGRLDVSPRGQLAGLVKAAAAALSEDLGAGPHARRTL